MPYPSQVLGCKKVSMHLQSSNLFFIYLAFVQPSLKAGMTQENKMHNWKTGIHWANSLETLTEVGCRPRVYHYLRKGSWFWQQLFDSKEVDDDILLLNSKNIQSQQVKLANFCEKEGYRNIPFPAFSVAISAGREKSWFRVHGQLQSLTGIHEHKHEHSHRVLSQAKLCLQPQAWNLVKMGNCNARSNSAVILSTTLNPWQIFNGIKSVFCSRFT